MLTIRHLLKQVVLHLIPSLKLDIFYLFLLFHGQAIQTISCHLTPLTLVTGLSAQQKRFASLSYDSFISCWLWRTLQLSDPEGVTTPTAAGGNSSGLLLFSRSSLKVSSENLSTADLPVSGLVSEPSMRPQLDFVLTHLVSALRRWVGCSAAADCSFCCFLRSLSLRISAGLFSRLSDAF